MCCCTKPNINGQLGYQWQSDDAPSIRPIAPPELSDSEILVRDEPGRCGGLDMHCHHFQLVKGSVGRYWLFVRHGGGEERVSLFKPEAEAMMQLESTPCYWIMSAIYHAYADGKRSGHGRTEETWRRAAAEKRIRTRKVRNSAGVKVWIEAAAWQGRRKGGRGLVSRSNRPLSSLARQMPFGQFSCGQPLGRRVSR